MPYDYALQKENLLFEEGQRLLLQVFCIVFSRLKNSGAFIQASVTEGIHEGCEGWDILACLDRLVELDYLREITPPSTPGQDRVFTAGRRMPL